MLQPSTISKLKNWLDEQGAKRILLITGARRRFADQVAAQIASLHVAIFPGAVTHVPKKAVEDAKAALHEAEADTIITLGGGSATGLGKALRREREVRFVAIPTTYSGSEMTAIYGVTDGDAKQTGRDERVRPDLVIHAPELTRDMPLGITATSIVNALAHPISALSTDSLSGDAREQAIGSVAALYRALEQLIEAPTHRDARLLALEGAAKAATALDRGTLGTHHKLAHFIGGRFKTDHSGLHSVLLPHFIRALQDSTTALYRELAQATGERDLPARIYDLLRRAGAHTALRDYKIAASDLESAMAEQSDLQIPWLWDAYLGRRPSIDTRRISLGSSHPASVRGPQLAQARRVVIVIHGRGSNADRAMTWANHILGDRPNVAMIAP